MSAGRRKASATLAGALSRGPNEARRPSPDSLIPQSSLTFFNRFLRSVSVSLILLRRK